MASFKRLLLQWSSLIIFGLIIVLGAVVFHTLSGYNLQPLTQAQVTIDSTAQSVALPYYQAIEDRSQLSKSSARYTFRLDAPLSAEDKASDSALSLVFFQAINGGDFYLNGVWLMNQPTSDEKARWAWYKPSLLQLPNKLLHGDGRDNELTVVNATREPFWLVPRAHLGHSHDVRVVYEILYYITHVLASATHFFALLVGFFMIGAWSSKSSGNSYGVVGIITICWSSLYALAMWEYVPLELHKAWRLSGYLLEGILFIVLPMHILNHCQRPFTKAQIQWFTFYASTGAVLYFLFEGQIENRLDIFWSLPLLVVYLYSVVRLGMYAVREKKGSSTALFLQSIITIFIGFHDYMILTGLIHAFDFNPSSWIAYFFISENVYFIHLGLPFMLIVMAQIWLEERQDYVIKIATNNQVLERALVDKENQLKISFFNESKLQKQSAANLERERIYQDVHDGIGSRLIATLFSARQGVLTPVEMEAQIKSCLDDLRLIINTDEDSTGDIQSAIFDYCVDLESHISNLDLDFQYDIDDTHAIHLFPRHHMNLLRIVQELVTNAIKHARATEILVELQQSDLAIDLVVTDNGIGLPAHINVQTPAPSTALGGRGLTGIALRAMQSGATYTAKPVAQGTCIHIQMPLINPQ
jgi:signal transduction histidine kinase